MKKERGNGDGGEGNTASRDAEKEGGEEKQKVDGFVGRLEVYKSGAVKMRLGDGIVYDVRSYLLPLSLSPRILRPYHTNVLKLKPHTMYFYFSHTTHRSQQRLNHPSSNMPYISIPRRKTYVSWGRSIGDL